MRLKHIAVSVLLLSGAVQALAEPFGFSRDARNTARAYRLENTAMERSDPRNGAPAPQQIDRRRGREFGNPDSSGYGAPGDNQSNAAPDNSRRQGRLTPEERRALRRQIDEAGHDIYAPKR